MGRHDYFDEADFSFLIEPTLYISLGRHDYSDEADFSFFNWADIVYNRHQKFNFKLERKSANPFFSSLFTSPALHDDPTCS